ncbi:MAG: hypothetical protein ACPGKV_06860 [Alteromonas macleodii]
MALENTTTNTAENGVSALLSKFGLHTADIENKSSNSTEVANEAATSGQSLPSLFASLLAIENQPNEADAIDSKISGEANLSTQSNTLTGTASDVQGALSLLSGTSSVNGVLSDDAIATMQGTLLNALQNNVFQSLVTNNETFNDTSVNATTSVLGNVDSNTAANNQSNTTPTLFDNLYSGAFGDDGLDLKDGFDVLNIANHLPIVSDIYEATTSNHTAAAASLAGSFLYGGIGGLMYNAIDLTVENVTGQSISNNMWSMGQSLLASVFSNPSIDSKVSANISGAPQTLASDATASIQTDDITAGITNKAADAAYQFVQRGIN